MIVVIVLCNKQARNAAAAAVGMLQRLILRGLRCLFPGMLFSNVLKALIIVATTSLQWNDSQGFFVWEN
jgi:hypothetical protein